MGLFLLLLVVGGVAAILYGLHRSEERRRDYVYRLERFEADTGRGYVVVRNADDTRLSWQSLPRSDGLESINVVGESNYRKQLQSGDFGAGRPVHLVREPDNPYDPNAIAVQDVYGDKCGYIPKDEAARLARRLDAGEAIRAIVMWEGRKGSRRVSVRLLLVDQEAAILLP